MFPPIDFATHRLFIKLSLANERFIGRLVEDMNVICMSFFHEKSSIGSRVKFGRNCYVAAFAAIRDDEGEISIGNNCSIQENCVLHNKVLIGNNVTVGHAAVVHGARVSDNCIIGIGSILLTGCEIGENCIIAAGALVPEGKKIPASSVVMGMPGKVVRECSAEDLARIKFSYEAYLAKLREMGKFEE